MKLGLYRSTLSKDEEKFSDYEFKIPSSFNYKNIMPPIKDQKDTYTCVPQTLTTILDVIKNSNSNTKSKDNHFSIDELYNARENKNLDGMSIKEGLDYLKNKGLNGTKISNYALCMSTLTAKQAIFMNGPVAIGMRCYENSDDRYWLPTRGSVSVGGHCTMLVGYNEKGFIMRNSWGRIYGEEGYIFLPNEDFNNYCFECWTITL